MSDQQTPSFERDIRALFRDKDRQRMEWAFDLWNHLDVKENAEQILERLEEGDMPCDGAWSPEQISQFKSWMEAGAPA
ncbi:MAG TPA: hypothetical protein VF660_07120 [Actinomycetota bacterium]